MLSRVAEDVPKTFVDKMATRDAAASEHATAWGRGGGLGRGVAGGRGRGGGHVSGASTGAGLPPMSRNLGAGSGSSESSSPIGSAAAWVPKASATPAPAETALPAKTPATTTTAWGTARGPWRGPARGETSTSARAEEPDRPGTETWSSRGSGRRRHGKGHGDAAPAWGGLGHAQDDTSQRSPSAADSTPPASTAADDEEASTAPPAPAPEVEKPAPAPTRKLGAWAKLAESEEDDEKQATAPPEAQKPPPAPAKKLGSWALLEDSDDEEAYAPPLPQFQKPAPMMINWERPAMKPGAWASLAEESDEEDCCFGDFEPEASRALSGQVVCRRPPSDDEYDYDEEAEEDWAETDDDDEFPVKVCRRPPSDDKNEDEDEDAKVDAETDKACGAEPAAVLSDVTLVDSGPSLGEAASGWGSSAPSGGGWERAFKRDDEMLWGCGLWCKKVEGDGACLFRAISDQLEGDGGASHMKYRSSCISFLEANQADFEPFIEEPFKEYISKLREPKAWGGHVEAQALSRALGVNALIYIPAEAKSADGVLECAIEVVTAEEDARCIQLCFHPRYHSGAHYNSVRSLGDSADGPPPASSLSELRARVAEALKARSLRAAAKRVARPPLSAPAPKATRASARTAA